MCRMVLNKSGEPVMEKSFIKNNGLRGLLATILCIGFASTAMAQIDMGQKPVLVITNKQMAPTNPGPIYSNPVRAPEITQQQIASAAYYGPESTMVGRKLDEINKDYFALQSSINRMSEKLRSIQTRNRDVAAGYYASIATINTQLQSGTTPGNPRLIAKLDVAQNNLDVLANNINALNNMAVELANAASQATFLVENVRAAFSLSGAIEEDHARLAMIEDQVNNTMVTIDRLLNNVNDDITRTNAYVASERNDLRTLALAVSNGDLYGKNLSNNPFSQAPTSPMMQQASYGAAPAAPVMQAPQMMGAPGMPMPSAPMATPSSPRPLAKIKFDKANIDYEQPIYMAVQEALQRYPNARFELIAVHPTSGNPAQAAIESTRARRNAERVLRTLTQMGVSLDQVDLSNSASPEAQTSEVHLYVR